ncbi:fumarylacetoacetate hydrolase [Pontibacter ummariensis]|uniref:fumarylacetoacetase n=1 Tax=Pontibacter ummariensis TaxID=1610492 RepID=A0A239L953_9BACT|nr:fumarylacetoacetase [Pontibacter ummariensis]PRY03987.1 fumarylacetoacetate hydrolase [Pontibacter ummariensis]SNT26512.1 fumarylacetoacetate hydrolase [Pontibacter ummariensis]
MIKANDPSLHSWIEIDPESDFPIQNLPFGVFQTADRDPRVGVAIGEYILDLCELGSRGFFELIDFDPNVFHRPSLNDFLAYGKPVWRAVRNRVSDLLRNDNDEICGDSDLIRKCLVLQQAAQMLLPVKVRNYTDFYSSLEHATNVGTMFRDPKQALLPNWKHLPVGYHGRASSIVVSGTPIHRPKGQIKAPDMDVPVFGPTRQLDFELEVAFITGKETQLGQSIPPHEAEEYIFGLVLFNDWSARDIQSWEYVPLGPFLGKSFASSISPWVVTLDALAPLKVKGPVQDPKPLPYLQFLGHHNYDIQLEVLLQPENRPATSVCRSNYKYLYWNMHQQLAHQSSNGCNIQVGDLYASGTISGADKGSYGSMLELTWRGTQPLQLADGSERSFVEDFDTVIMRGYGQHHGIRIGFGEVRSRVLPAV